MSSYKLKTAPASELISVSDAKVHLNIVGDTYWDSMIGTLITAARQMCETYTWRSIGSQTWTLYVDYASLTDIIYLTKCPITSVTSVKYYDKDNSLQTLSTSAYQVDLVGEPGRIKINSMPQIYDRLNALEIEFVCGYDSTTLPKPLYQAMMLIIGHLFEHREDVVFNGNAGQLPNGSKYLMDSYVLNWVYPYQS